MEDLLLDSLITKANVEIELNQEVLQKVRDDQHERDSRQAYLHGKVI